jgi:pantoate--beta-alanine ligase
VATVVAILFGLVRPDVAVFGEKDAQQLAVVRALARDLALGVEIVSGPTVREADGLALSSRNAYLAPDERRRATVLARALGRAEAAIAAGEREAAALERAVAAAVAAEPGVELEYVRVVDPDTFQPVATLAGPIVLPVAARVGTTRLLDNLRINVPVTHESPARS